MTRNKSEDISDIFTPEGIGKLKRGQLLRFDMEGSITELKITYINKNTQKVRAIRVNTYLPNEVSVEDRTDGK